MINIVSYSAFAVFQPITDSGNEYWIGNIDSTQPTVTLETDEFDELNIQTLSNDETDSEGRLSCLNLASMCFR
jgi:hypothetical protein